MERVGGSTVSPNASNRSISDWKDASSPHLHTKSKQSKSALDHPDASGQDGSLIRSNQIQGARARSGLGIDLELNDCVGHVVGGEPADQMGRINSDVPSIEPEPGARHCL